MYLIEINKLTLKKEFLLVDEININEGNINLNYSDNPIIRVNNLNGGWSEV